MAQLPVIEMGIRHQDSKWNLVDIEYLKIPKNGWICAVDRYWAVIDNQVVFYENSPICNGNEKLVQYLIDKEEALSGAIPIKFSILYLKPNYDQ